MIDPVYINGEFIDQYTNYRELIEALRAAFKNHRINVPPRHHHNFSNTELGRDTTILLMPAWQDGIDGGVKVVSVSPENGQLGLPSIHGSYIYMDAKTGAVKAIIEAKKLTSKRTAAASALASELLSSRDSQRMLMIGSGALSAELVVAHATVRPIEHVYIWGRNMNKAKAVCTRLKDRDFDSEAVRDIDSVIRQADIISVATMSRFPLIHGTHLELGQHIDLVGAFKPDMREADDDVIKRACLYCDVMDMAIKESGDLYIPLQEELITLADIKGDLFSLCDSGVGRKSKDEITLFKSVGHALEDLVAARYYYHKFCKLNDIPED